VKMSIMTVGENQMTVGENVPESRRRYDALHTVVVVPSLVNLVSTGPYV
jgi:hypothetical protein